MESVKSAAVPGLLAFAGVKAGQMFAPSSSIWQIVGGIGGAILGIVIARKV